MTSQSTTVYECRVKGLWNTRHTLTGPDGELGTLSLRRNAWGMVVQGRYTPLQGEVLVMRRDPGLLRSQFSLWTEEGEWLGSSLRWSFSRREITISTGSKPIRLVPVPGFGRGWRLVAPKTGEMARLHCEPFSRRARIEVHRRLDLELVIFSYALGAQVLLESFWPGPDPRRALDSEPAAQNA
jgi:hypothetical protein